MASEKWGYSEGAHRYRNLETGRFLSPTTVIETRDDFLNRRVDVMKGLADLVGQGDITVQRFEKEMQSQIRKVFGAEFAYGRGGRNLVSADNWQMAADLAHEQFSYLRTFAEAVSDGKLSLAQIKARAALYAGSAVQSYERGREASFTGLKLPGYPSVGTQCQAQCRCSWRIEETDTEYRCTWIRESGESCVTCTDRASKWAPFTQDKPEEARFAPILPLTFWRVNGHV